MERNLHTDDFEQLLREKSEEFRMYPSKRIWHSIYNNIHPGRKWPSVAMSITLITSLLLVGYLNTKNPATYNSSKEQLTGQKAATQIKSPLNSSIAFIDQQAMETPTASIQNSATGSVSKSNLKENTFIRNKINSPVVKVSTNAKLALVATINESNVSGSENLDAVTSRNTKVQPNAAVFQTDLTNDGVSQKSPTIQFDNTRHDQMLSGYDEPEGLVSMQKTTRNQILEYVPFEQYGVNNNADGKMGVSIRSGNSYVEKNNLATNKQDFVSDQELGWIENYALYNRPAAKKWANKLSWQMYAAPSVVYRKLYNDFNFGSVLNAPPLAISSSGDINSDVIQKPSLGFEVGTGLQFSLSKWVKLKAGLQLNYTRYNSNAFQNTHPVATRLSMHDYTTNMSYEENRTTSYSNKSGPEPIKLHNETFQIALPIGMDFKLIGNESLQFNAGATIQPTFVPTGKSYLISSDRRYYVKETSMLNNWNLNAGFETFVTYKSNGITYQIGPQFRTQLFSTNNRKFAVEEKLLTYGLKFGITKTLK